MLLRMIYNGVDYFCIDVMLFSSCDIEILCQILGERKGYESKGQFSY